MGDKIQKVSLIGFPGTGKSSVCNELEKSGFVTKDLDLEVEQYCNKSITEIIRVEGIDYFRQIETEVLKKVIKGNFQCLSLGGGAIFTSANREILKENFITVISIECDYEVLVNRLLNDEKESFSKNNQAKRPLFAIACEEYDELSIKKLIRKLYNERIDRYKEYSNQVIDCKTLDPIEIAKLISKVILKK